MRNLFVLILLCTSLSIIAQTTYYDALTLNEAYPQYQQFFQDIEQIKTNTLKN